jgi:hypothetical protein
MITNPLAKSHVNEKVIEAQQSSTTESVGKKSSEAVVQDLITLPVDSASLNETIKYPVRATQSFRKTVEDVKDTIDEDTPDVKDDRTGFFDVNSFLGEKPQTVDSTGMERTSVSKFAGNDKYLYDD